MSLHEPSTTRTDFDELIRQSLHAQVAAAYPAPTTRWSLLWRASEMYQKLQFTFLAPASDIPAVSVPWTELGWRELARENAIRMFGVMSSAPCPR